MLGVASVPRPREAHHSVGVILIAAFHHYVLRMVHHGRRHAVGVAILWVLHEHDMSQSIERLKTYLFSSFYSFLARWFKKTNSLFPKSRHTCTCSFPRESTQPSVMSAPRIPPLGENPSPTQPLVATYKAGKREVTTQDIMLAMEGVCCKE